MKGLELSRGYYNDICRPAIEEHFKKHINKMAFGLVGDGSECYGFDDEISQDHDFGPRIMVWLSTDDYRQFGTELHKFILNLPKNYMGYESVNKSQYGDEREGVFSITDFFKKITGLDHLPESLIEWMRIPEVNLSIATNGEVFSDISGKFSNYRALLLAGYPEDVRLKMIAARCMKAAQSGQYNFPRCIKRKEFTAAQVALAEFINTICSLIYLLNNRYKPFYKWMHRGLNDLSLLGKEISPLLNSISLSNDHIKSIGLIEQICGLVINTLREKELSDSKSDFLLDHAPLVQQKIKDDYLKTMMPWG